MLVTKKIDWAAYQFIAEAGRATYFPMAYFIIHAYWRAARHTQWPLRIPVLGDFSKYSTRWHYAIRDPHVFDPYLMRFLMAPKEMRAFEQYIAAQRMHVRHLFPCDTCSTVSNHELVSDVEKFYSCFQDLIVAAGTLRYLDRALVPAVQHAYRLHKKRDALVAIVSMGAQVSFALREEYAMLALAAGLQKRHDSITSSAAVSGIKKIWSTYRWSSCGYYNEQLKTIAVYTTELRALLKQDSIRAFRAMRFRIRADQQKRRAALRLLEPRDRSLGILAGQATVAKDEYRFVASELIGRAMPLFREIARRTGYSVDAVRDLLPKEVRALLLGKPYPSALVRARRRAIVIYGGPGFFQVLLGRAADTFARRHLHHGDRDATTWHGRAASPGHVRGTARVVLNVNDFHKVKRGDILVCLNTSPEFMPVLRKVAGIIGEEGGITAHVSVVSRELGIPCVVAINGATLHLKDGDWVDLDAARGIIKKVI
ncbi:hypothetical protein HY624_01500 [Candidatus Uhrbacteria bacterium]|nr:hypothetical protein [Candidatus Uhrbacteria bacterium]